MLKGLGNIGDMAKMMKQAQDMQTKMTEMKEELHNITVVGQSGCRSRQGHSLCQR